MTSWIHIFLSFCAFSFLLLRLFMANHDSQLENGLRPTKSKNRNRQRNRQREQPQVFCEDSDFQSVPAAAPIPPNAWKMPQQALPDVSLHHGAMPTAHTTSAAGVQLPAPPNTTSAAGMQTLHGAVPPNTTSAASLQPPVPPNTLSATSQKTLPPSSAWSDAPRHQLTDKHSRQPADKHSRQPAVKHSRQPADKHSRQPAIRERQSTASTTAAEKAARAQELWDTILVLEFLAGKQKEQGNYDVVKYLRTGHPHDFKF